MFSSGKPQHDAIVSDVLSLSRCSPINYISSKPIVSDAFTGNLMNQIDVQTEQPCKNRVHVI